LNDAGYKRWVKTKWWSEDYTHLWQTESDALQTESKASVTCAKETVVYLTADANEELTELRTDETYIIGGIVNRNRYKVIRASVPEMRLNTHCMTESVREQSQGSQHSDCALTNSNVSR